MSFQTIFDIQQSMTIQNRRVVGQQYSRSGQVRTAQYLTTVPWVFDVTPHSYLYYPQARLIIQTIDNLDRQYSETITFDTPNLFWFTKYQGDLTYAERTQMTVYEVPVSNSQVIKLGNLPSVLATTVMFKAGDFIQFGNYTYKITADVVRGILPYIEVSLHRPIIGTITTGMTVIVGQEVTFNVVAETCPTYKLNPMTEGAYVEWTQNFVFRENITG